jgi:hypothetical protein
MPLTLQVFGDFGDDQFLNAPSVRRITNIHLTTKPAFMQVLLPAGVLSFVITALQIFVFALNGLALL